MLIKFFILKQMICNTFFFEAQLKYYIGVQNKKNKTYFVNNLKIMIDQMTYSQIQQSNLSSPLYQQQISHQKPDNYDDDTNDLINYKMPSKQIKFIKQLKTRDIKLRQLFIEQLCSHKKIQLHQSKGSSIFKNISSMQNEKQVLQDQSSLATRNFPSEQLKKSSKYRHNYLVQRQKQKQKIPVEVISSFNPEHLISKQASIFINEKLGKKTRVSELPSNLNSKIRQSRSQNKRQKNINTSNNMQITNLKKIIHQNETNIFQNLEMIGKQGSHHSLQKCTPHFSVHTNSRLEQKLHLPSLVNSNQGSKNLRSKLSHNSQIQTQQIQANNQYENQKSYNLNQNGSMTQKSSPYLQKIVKIPIDRLKPLKPQEIKLKYQKKVKQQQKNRAKQIALHIFQKQQQQIERLRNKTKNYDNDLQSDQNVCLQNQNQNQNKKYDVPQVSVNRHKTSNIKKEKGLANRGQNIFKKQLMAFNGNNQY